MISICIPVFNYDVSLLVNSMMMQVAEIEDEKFEVICVDDGSTKEWREKNRGVGASKYIELEENVGRARVRNQFLNYTSGEYLLFLDVDSEVRDGFLKRYVEAKKMDVEVVVGGRVYDKRGNDKEHRLRYLYGIQVESRSVEQRRKFPYRSFMTNNFMVKREVLEQIPFDEQIVRYGHEDTLFGYRLEQERIRIEHIDNPVVNGEVETNEEFLHKTVEGLENLAELYCRMKDDRGFCQSVKLLDAYTKVKRWGMMPMVRMMYCLLKRPLVSHFERGEAISVKQFNFYKLGMFATIMRKKI